MLIVDVSASTEAFVETVCLIAVRCSFSGRTGCRRCVRVGRTPRLCSSLAGEQNKSAVTDHAISLNHVIDWDQAKVIDRASNRVDR